MNQKDEVTGDRVAAAYKDNAASVEVAESPRAPAASTPISESERKDGGVGTAVLRAR